MSVRLFLCLSVCFLRLTVATFELRERSAIQPAVTCLEFSFRCWLCALYKCLSYLAASLYDVDAAHCYWQSSMVCLSFVCLSVTVVSRAKTAEPIKMPFWMWTWMGPRKRVLDWGAPWRYLANTIEPCTCYGDVALCQIWPPVTDRTTRTIFVR